MTTQFLSVDCFVDSRTPQNMTVEFQVTNGILTQISDDSMLFSANGDIDRSFFKKVIVLVLIPFVVVFLSVAFWTAY